MASAKKLLEAISEKTGKSLEETIAENYAHAIETNNKTAMLKYEQLILNKLLADKIDYTTDGEQLSTTFNFSQGELPDWNDKK